jgi:hypothetical protein
MISSQRLLKRIHVFGTAWFLLCAATLLVVSLRQAGFNWWFVFSVSGYSAILFAFLITFYLFALFRGVVRTQCSIEHPLSTTPAYFFFYDAAPFLGAVAGLLCGVGVSDSWAIVRMTTEGTLGMTFVTWVVVDSLVGLVESLLPQSRKSRTVRNAASRAEKERIKRDNSVMLESLERRERDLHRDWLASFSEAAARLAELYCSDQAATEQARTLTADVGAQAWRMGKMACMRFVHRLILERMRSCGDRPCIDYAAFWWDGIGAWRRPQNTRPTAKA